MFTLDDNFLTDLGYGEMPVEERKAFLLHILHELEVRVGDALSKNLSDQQMDEFEEIIKSIDSNQALSWLEQNCPSYQETVTSIMETLKQELIENRERLVNITTQGNYELAA